MSNDELFLAGMIGAWTITQMLRRRGVVGKFVEIFGPGLDQFSLADRPPSNVTAIRLPRKHLSAKGD